MNIHVFVFWRNAHSKKLTSFSKSATGLLPCSHQVDIRMRSHHLLRLDDNKSTASCQTGLLQVDSQRCLIHKLNASCFNKLKQVYEYQVLIASAIGASEYVRNPGLFFVLVLSLSKSRNGFKTKVALG